MLPPKKESCVFFSSGTRFMVRLSRAQSADPDLVPFSVSQLRTKEKHQSRQPPDVYVL